MVLELLEGMDLAKLTKAKGPLPVADAVEYVLQACEALVEAHAAGIVHRDLKPQNLFVTRRLNGTPLVKVLDFGIAKAFGPGAVGQMALTDSAAIIGSPLYMAPEQMRSARTAEVRSDIWALGVILYELLGGRLPFDGETVTEVCIRVVNERPAPLLELRPGARPRARRHRDALPREGARAALPQRVGARRRARAVLAQREAGRSRASVAFVRGHPGLARRRQPVRRGPRDRRRDRALHRGHDPDVAADRRREPSEDERRARAHAGSTKVSAGSGRPPPRANVVSRSSRRT